MNASFNAIAGQLLETLLLGTYRFWRQVVSALHLLLPNTSNHMGSSRFSVSNHLSVDALPNYGLKLTSRLVALARDHLGSYAVTQRPARPKRRLAA